MTEHDQLWQRIGNTFAEVAEMENQLAISVSQVQEIELLVAHWRAFKMLRPVSSIDEAEAYNELDEQADRVAGIVREVRKLGS